MSSLGVAVVLAIVGVLLLSSDVAPVGTIGPAGASSANDADAKPTVARSRPEVQRRARVLQDRDRDTVLGIVLLFGMYEGRHGR
jgi:hypothetical protein